MLNITIHSQHGVEAVVIVLTFVICAFVWLFADPRTVERRNRRAASRKGPPGPERQRRTNHAAHHRADHPTPGEHR